METEVKTNGCVILIGDPMMPNLRVHNPQVRNVAHSPVCLNYNPVIFKFLNRSFYNGRLINPFESDPAQVDTPLVSKPISGSATMLGWSKHNDAKVACCLESIKELIEGRVDKQCIGVLTTYCAQKEKILEDCSRCYEYVLVGLMQDFKNTIRPHLIISTVETGVRISGGKR